MSKPASARPALDPRVLRSRSAVIEATRALLREEGFSGTTIDAVASRSGVAKTTIYRQWSDRNALLVDAFVMEAVPIAVPSTNDLRADLLAALQQLAAELSRSEWARLMPAMLEASERDPEFLRLSQASLLSRRAPLLDRLKRAASNGDLSKGTDIEELMSLLVGPLFYRRLIVHQPITKSLVVATVDSMLALHG